MTNHKILISIVVVAILAVAGFLLYKNQNNISTSQSLIANFEECAQAGYPVMESYPRQCRAQDGKLFVEEVTNPGPLQADKIISGYVSGQVSIGPNCPGPERDDVPCDPGSEIYTSREVIVYNSDSTTEVKRVYLDSRGNYKISLAPGTYFLQIEPAGIRPGEKKKAVVKSRETTVVNFDIDTGIR